VRNFARKVRLLTRSLNTRQPALGNAPLTFSHLGTFGVADELQTKYEGGA